MRTEVAALWRFHLASGARVALRQSIPIAGAFVVAVGLSQYPGATLASFAASVAAPNPEILFVAGTSAVAFFLAAWAAPRVAAGSSGWMRSLPVDAAAQRRGLALGVAAALGPMTLTLLVAVAGVAAYGQGWNGARAAALIPLALGASYAALPLERRYLASPLASVGAVVAIAGGWIHVAIGMALVAAADTVAGPVVVHARVRSFRGFAWGSGLPWKIVLRAVGTGVLGVWTAGAVPILAGALFLVNNELPVALARRGARLSIGIAIVVTLAALADSLALRRPPWPWARSLPWSSRQRVVDDAVALAALTLPIVVAGIALDARSGCLAILALPVAASRAAAALRYTGEGRTAVPGPILIEGCLGAVAFALMPWLAVVLLAATPWALSVASRRDSTWKVGRWTAVHRLPSGDPADWTGR